MKLIVSLLFVGLMLLSQSAFARSSYPPLLNAKLGTSGLSCAACHSGSPGTIYPMGATWTLANLVAADADGDGQSNGIEVRMGTDFNSAALKSTGALSGKFFISGSSAISMTSAAATDLYAETLNNFNLTGSDVIIGGVSLSPTLGTAGPVIVAYESANILTATVYEVVGATVTALTATINPKGSISFTTTSATPKLIIVGTVATAATTTAPGGASVTGCVTNSATTPLLMLLALLSLGFFIRRKQD